MRSLPRCTTLALLGAAALWTALPAAAQPSPATPDAPVPPAPAAPLAVDVREAEPAQTPGDVLTWFLEATHEGDFETGASILSLDDVPLAKRAHEGPRLARRLMFLLDQHLTLEPGRAAPTGAGVSSVVVGELPLGRTLVPVELVREPQGTAPAWRFSRRTVRAIDALYAEHGSRAWELLPQALVSRSFWVLGAWQWLGFVLVLALAFGLARVVTAALTPVLMRLARLTTTDLDDKLVVRLRRPARVILFLAVADLGTRALAFPAEAQGLVDDVARSVVVAALVWAVLVVSRLVAEALEARAAEGDETSARAVRTQVTVLHRVVDTVVLVVGGALVLLQFPGVRHIGMSLLASAGVAGVVVGLAAQRSISNLLAGIQISLTQPIRIGDTVIVEKEWGWIEEITLTYVVVKVWDLRRLVVPISTFLEKPFQNWSRGSTELLGTVEVYADYRVDVGAARAELLRLVEAERGKLWNGKVHGIQVTELSERTMTLRALVSADDAGKAWDLRCLVREGLVAWLKGQPDALPRLRTEPAGTPAAPGARADGGAAPPT